MATKKKGKKRGAPKGDASSAPLRIEELERRVALSVPSQKKLPMPSPYMPGTDYGLVKRDNLKRREDESSDEPAKELKVEELEERVALSVPTQKKMASPMPYMPGTRYGLVKREHLEEREAEAEEKRPEELRVDELEERVALSVPTQKKMASPMPYMPGTLYGLAKRENLKKRKDASAGEPAKELKVEELEERVALSVPTQKKNPLPAPYMPGTYYGLVKRGNL